MAFKVIPNSGISLLVRQLRTGHYNIIALLNSISPTGINVSVKDGVLMLKVKNKHVLQTEEFTEPRQTDLWCQYSNLPFPFRSQGGRDGEEQKELHSPHD